MDGQLASCGPISLDWTGDETGPPLFVCSFNVCVCDDEQWECMTTSNGGGCVYNDTMP